MTTEGGSVRSTTVQLLAGLQMEADLQIHTRIWPE